MNELSILQKLGWVAMSPYPHMVIENCLPEPLYEALEKTRPSDEAIVNGRSFTSNMRMDLHARQLLAREDLPSDWREFIRYHTSVTFWRDILHVFGPGIPKIKTVPRLALMPTAVRTNPPDKQVISLDVNVGVNTPVVGPATRVRGPHVDNPIELFAAMLYMPPKDAPDEGGDFVIYEKTRPVRFEGKAEVRREDERSLVEHARVRYERNTMVAFINSVDAIHGVTPRQSGDFRRMVNFCAELPSAAFMIPR